ncbi:MAG TPA: class I SAM-dependent methyltransferase [Gaiellaceae bacterium]|nr:class I SAM-dependent methyltransferase [Gaiellaceae bacterium]
MTVREEPLYDLAAFADARRLADWQFAQFERHVGPRTAEIGAGIGTFSERLLASGVEELLLIEPEEPSARILEARFGGDRRVRVVREGLPESPTLVRAPSSFDFLLCQNVLEHIEDDEAAVGAMAAALRPGGILGILVPGHPRLYGSVDAAYGHFRRYTTGAVAKVLTIAGLELLELRPFNLLGVPGWWVRSHGATSIDRRSLVVYEAMLRLWRPIEDRIRPRWGLSVVALARKPA